MPQRPIPATYMRGGTSKGVFFVPSDLPADAAERDAVLLRVTGSPDPYGQQIDGMGGATSSTSKVVLVSRSTRPDCDVDYLFGAVAVREATIDWSGNCGNLTSAVAPFAIQRGLIDVPKNGTARVVIWQANIGKKIIAHVPMADGEVVETGDYLLDGVTFPAAEILLEFMDPGADEEDGSMFPGGAPITVLEVPGIGQVEATLINAGNPHVFVDAAVLGLAGTELQANVNGDQALLDKAETIRAHGAVAMGLARSAEEAMRTRPHTPKLAFFAPPAEYKASSGKQILSSEIDMLARIFSMGRLHHAMTGTGAVAIASAAAVPGTVVSRLLGKTVSCVRLGHPSGMLEVGAQAIEQDGAWRITQVAVSRSARRLMEGVVLVPDRL
ncbi:2-methylaconitate cis-trans isomerase PrpF [Luteimonas panaciterrae]|uniref:2-methylaconitate cis-trans isomerase PrpF n=1 Tax=Luteimonas panaciterrae TaxID=363885 RepID=UPI001CFBC84D|nr:2-methylaconitate cis-trans isomerase PrpF [Luteimonas panaciterrae]